MAHEEDAGDGHGDDPPGRRSWRAVIGLTVRGWVHAYFWTTAAFLYLQLRQDLDGTPWTGVKPATKPEAGPETAIRQDPGP